MGPAPEYKFLCAVNPVGNYYPGGLQAIPSMVMSDYDRAAPMGIGGVKVSRYTINLETGPYLATKFSTS